jgi:phage shock protein PspC (stress-responsive transcriptional regulator)
MEVLRELMATLLFIAGSFFIVVIFNEFTWVSFLGGIICYVIAYFMWPSKKRGQREKESPFLDILEFVIEFPVEIFMWILKLFSRIFRNKNGDFDVDIDL